MAPIRVGIIGVSTPTNQLGAGAWGSMVHLPSLQSLPGQYEIVAVANSTVESAERSIKAHKLPPSTKAYGKPEDVAKDPDVDLVVVTVRVAKHYQLAKPALLHGKNVFVEWPLAATSDEVDELARLANEGGMRTIVGLQARAAPLVQKLKQVLASGQIGPVLSSTVVMCWSQFVTETWPEHLKYFLDISSGGNELTIPFGHFLDSFVQLLGDIPEPHAILQTKFQDKKLTNSDGEVTVPQYKKTSPDHIFVQGITTQGVLSSFAVRSVTEPADKVSIRWVISGTKGEAYVTSPESWQMLDREPELHIKTGEGPIQKVSFDEDRTEAADKVTSMSANVASLYTAFARGDGDKYATFESAAKTHRLLERIKSAAAR